MNRLSEIAYYKVGRTIIRENEDDLSLDQISNEDIENNNESGESLDGESFDNFDDTSSGEVEVDVTELVKKQEENSSKIDNIQNSINTNFQQLMGLINQMQSDVISKDEIEDMMDQTTKEIRHQIIKQNPTATQKLELRSYDSAPFTTSIKDFWEENIPDNYFIDDTSNVKVQKEVPDNIIDKDNRNKYEYRLTDVDIERDYNEQDILKTLYF